MTRKNRKRTPRPPVPIHPEARLLSVEQAGVVAGIGRAHAYELVARGLIPTVRLGRKLRVPRAQLVDLIERNKLTTAPVGGAAR